VQREVSGLSSYRKGGSGGLAAREIQMSNDDAESQRPVARVRLIKRKSGDMLISAPTGAAAAASSISSNASSAAAPLRRTILNPRAVAASAADYAAAAADDDDEPRYQLALDPDAAIKRARFVVANDSQQQQQQQAVPIAQPLPQQAGRGQVITHPLPSAFPPMYSPAAAAPAAAVPAVPSSAVSAAVSSAATVLLRNLAAGATAKLLITQLFSPYSIAALRVDTDGRGGGCAGTAEADFLVLSEAMEAVRTLQGRMLLGQPVRLTLLSERGDDTAAGNSNGNAMSYELTGTVPPAAAAAPASSVVHASAASISAATAATAASVSSPADSFTGPLFSQPSNASLAPSLGPADVMFNITNRGLLTPSLAMGATATTAAQSYGSSGPLQLAREGQHMPPQQQQQQQQHPSAFHSQQSYQSPVYSSQAQSAHSQQAHYPTDASNGARRSRLVRPKSVVLAGDAAMAGVHSFIIGQPRQY
jgi:hypothetical protein